MQKEFEYTISSSIEDFIQLWAGYLAALELTRLTLNISDAETTTFPRAKLVKPQNGIEKYVFPKPLFSKDDKTVIIHGLLTRLNPDQSLTSGVTREPIARFDFTQWSDGRTYLKAGCEDIGGLVEMFTQLLGKTLLVTDGKPLLDTLSEDITAASQSAWLNHTAGGLQPGWYPVNSTGRLAIDAANAVIANLPGLVGKPGADLAGEQASAPAVQADSDEIPSKKAILDRACIQWASRGYLPQYNLDEFLSEFNNETGIFLSRREFKLALQDAGKRGLIQKNNGRWRK